MLHININIIIVILNDVAHLFKNDHSYNESLG